jgi:hypothetical protein
MGLGSGILDPGSGKNLFRIPDPEVKKATDTGSATLLQTYGLKGLDQRDFYSDLELPYFCQMFKLNLFLRDK